MRLIDADKVIIEIVHKYGRGQGDAILEIDAAPTVEAIPVKWIEKYEETDDLAASIYRMLEVCERLKRHETH